MVLNNRACKSFGLGVALSAALVVAGCASNSGGTNAQTAASSDSSAGGSSKVDTAAATLRQTLDSLLQENVVLTADATNAALAGRTDEFTAAKDSLDQNSQDLADTMGEIYGKDMRNSFLNLWNKHIGFVIDYTQGVVAKDQNRQDAAINSLVGYCDDFGSFLDSASEGRLKKDAVAELFKTHVKGLKDIIDYQAAKDFATAYSRERDSEKQTFVIGNALADAIADQYPDKF
jgi:hypothetical protein